MRRRPGGGDLAVDLAVGVELAAVFDLEIQPQAVALGHHLAAVRFAGQVHPGAGAVLHPIAVVPLIRVYVHAEALGAAGRGERRVKVQQPYRHLHTLGQLGRRGLLLQAGDARLVVGADLAVLAADDQGGATDRADCGLLAVADAVAVAVAVGAIRADAPALIGVGHAVAVPVWLRRRRGGGGDGWGRRGAEVGHDRHPETAHVVAGLVLYRLEVVADGGVGAAVGRGVGVADGQRIAVGHGARQRPRDGLGPCLHPHL